MIHFMLENPGQETFRFIHDDFAMALQGPPLDTLATLYIAIIPGNAEAAFGAILQFF